MASSTLRSGTEAETGGVVLPIDVIYEILIRLPAEDLCRLCVVCQQWRSLLSDPQFIAAHAAAHVAAHRRSSPLFVVGRGKSDKDGFILCCIQDLSGRVIKRIRLEREEWLVSTQCNLACVARGKNSKLCQLINLITGERFSLPSGLSREHTPRRLDFLKKYTICVAFGQVASTREFKLLRVIENNFDTVPREQICEVLTHVGCQGARWRGKKAAQGCVDMSSLSRVVIDGVVYFLLDEYVSSQDVRPKGIASFDLLTEEWRPILRGPAPILAKNRYACLSLAALNGSLVLARCRPHVSMDLVRKKQKIESISMDLWFLMDFEKGLWVKKPTVEINLHGFVDYLAHPLVMLENERIVIYIRAKEVLTIYNLRTRTCTDVVKLGYRCFSEISLYTGNLLSLANDAI